MCDGDEEGLGKSPSGWTEMPRWLHWPPLKPKIILSLFPVVTSANAIVYMQHAASVRYLGAYNFEINICNVEMALPLTVLFQKYLFWKKLYRHSFHGAPLVPKQLFTHYHSSAFRQTAHVKTETVELHERLANNQ